MGREKLGYGLTQQLAKFAEECLLGWRSNYLKVLNKRATCPKSGSRRCTGDVTPQYLIIYAKSV